MTASPGQPVPGRNARDGRGDGRLVRVQRDGRHAGAGLAAGRRQGRGDVPQAAVDEGEPAAVSSTSVVATRVRPAAGGLIGAAHHQTVPLSSATMSSVGQGDDPRPRSGGTPSPQTPRRGTHPPGPPGGHVPHTRPAALLAAEVIDELWERRAELSPADEQARAAVVGAVDAIDAGQARVAVRRPGDR